MEKKFRITVDGRAYVVTVEDLTAEGAQRLYPEPGTMAAAAPAAPSAPAAAAPPPAAPAAAGPGDVVAPLAGVVKVVHVAAGAVVAEGDKLVALEAMKMITEVTATRRCTVAAVAVKAGDPVEAGQLLLSVS